MSGIDRVMAGDIESSSIFVVRIADSFGTVVSPQSHVVIGVAVALMCLMLFAMQWLLIHRNTPKDAMDSPQFRTQKLTAFVFPAIYVVSGGTLPFGVLLYWLTNNLWNFGQTLCQLRWFPAPGSEAGSARPNATMSGRTGTAPPPDCRLWKKSARRPRVRRPTCRNRRQRKNVQLAKRRWHMGEVTGDALRPSSPERFEVLYCLHYAAMPERKRIQDLTMTG